MLKSYVKGTLLLIAVIWILLAFFAVYMLTWYDWMTWIGLFYTGFCILMGAAFYLAEGRGKHEDRD